VDVIWLNENPTIEYQYRLSWRRSINSILVGLQAKLKTHRIIGYPRHLIVDLVNTCGLKCPICPNGRGEIQRESGVISNELFTYIMKTLGNYLFTLTLTNWGEPLRHPNILGLLAIARKYPCYIGFSSNFQHLSPALADGLVQSGLDEIGVSVDGATASVYNKYRVGGSFDKAMNNLRLLVERRRYLNASSPKIRWQVLLNRHTENETDAIIHLAEKTGVDSVVFVPILIDISRMFTHTPEERLKRDADWLPENPEFVIYDKSGRLKGNPRFCSKLWDTMVVHPDGAVSPCCAVIDPANDFGRLTVNGSFYKTWNSPSYKAARRRMSGCKDCLPETVCENCARYGVMIY
jgi:radical SAM protein with 4Fe4S-binding SPASM domain